jgi:hypothetical protein
MVASLFTEPPFWYYSDGWAMSKLPYLYRVPVQATANKVIFKRFRVQGEVPETIPEGLKPRSFRGACGTAEAVPFQSINDPLCGDHD